jgi:hypothetical protein
VSRREGSFSPLVGPAQPLHRHRHHPRAVRRACLPPCPSKPVSEVAGLSASGAAAGKPRTACCWTSWHARGRPAKTPHPPPLFAGPCRPKRAAPRRVTAPPSLRRAPARPACFNGCVESVSWASWGPRLALPLGTRTLREKPTPSTAARTAEVSWCLALGSRAAHGESSAPISVWSHCITALSLHCTAPLASWRCRARSR